MPTICRAYPDRRAIEAADLLIVLGGPIGVYETNAHPFLAEDIAVLERLARGRPSLSICLGCQLMARALGARVFPGPVKEIGWGGVDQTEASWSRACGPLAEEAATVLHWHGDTFDLPSGAVRLAANANYQNQAFAFGRSALALQFHIEADPASLSRLAGRPCGGAGRYQDCCRRIACGDLSHCDPGERPGATDF